MCAAIGPVEKCGQFEQCERGHYLLLFLLSYEGMYSTLLYWKKLYLSDSYCIIVICHNNSVNKIISVYDNNEKKKSLLYGITKIT